MHNSAMNTWAIQSIINLDEWPHRATTRELSFSEQDELFGWLKTLRDPCDPQSYVSHMFIRTAVANAITIWLRSESDRVELLLRYG